MNMNVKMNAGDLLAQGIDAIVQMRMQSEKKPVIEPEELTNAEFDEDAFADGLKAIFGAEKSSN